MAVSKAPTIKALRLGSELRRLRSEAGLTLNAVGDRLGWDASKVSRQERAKAGVPAAELKRLLALYDATPAEHRELGALVEDGQSRNWWREYDDVLTPNLLSYVALESEATTLMEYQLIAVPGLLQTPAYATAVNGSGFRSLGQEQVEASVELRMRRQRRLVEPPMLKLHALMSEAALLVGTGGDEVMREQFAHLSTAARLPNVTLQVVPFSAGRPGVASGGFMLFRYADGDPDLLFVESLSGTIPRESAREVRRCARLFERIRRVALSPEETLACLDRRLDGM